MGLCCRRTFDWKGRRAFVAPTVGPIDRVIGVYSGRKDDTPGEAQIGMVWHVDYIDDIDGNKRDI
jgi:hypothetical protein